MAENAGTLLRASFQWPMVPYRMVHSSWRLEENCCRIHYLIAYILKVELWSNPKRR